MRSMKRSVRDRADEYVGNVPGTMTGGEWSETRKQPFAVCGPRSVSTNRLMKPTDGHPSASRHGIPHSTFRIPHSASRPGVAILAFVAALLVVASLVLWMLQLTATSTSASLAHFISTGAFYAAESGVELAAWEIGLGADVDNEGDGTYGTISDNDDDADDPALTSGILRVEQVSPSPPLYHAVGRPAQNGAPWSDYRRIIEFRTE